MGMVDVTPLEVIIVAGDRVGGTGCGLIFQIIVTYEFFRFFVQVVAIEVKYMSFLHAV